MILTAKSLGNRNEAVEADEVEVSISEVRVLNYLISERRNLF